MAAAGGVDVPHGHRRLDTARGATQKCPEVADLTFVDHY